jgi:integrase
MRLPNGFGSVYKLSGKRRNPWCARKTVGWSFDEIKMKSYPVYKFVGYYPTRKDAMIALTEFNADPFDLQARTITFADVYAKWSDEHFESVSKSQVAGYKASYNACQCLHNMKMSEIKLDHLQHAVDVSGKNTPSLKKMKQLFNQLFDWCVKHEIVTPDRRQLVSYVDISKAGNPNPQEHVPFTNAELQTLWNHADESIYIRTILILIYSGVRISELLDLKKSDVHLDENYFDIVASKTESGIRSVPISAKIKPFFQEWMQTDSEYFLTNRNGEKFQYRNYYDNYWNSILDQLGMKHRPHDTRHTCVSLLVAAGVDDRLVKKIVGHKGLGVTQQVYTHLEIETLLDAINKI